jgi:RIO kinase 3
MSTADTMGPIEPDAAAEAWGGWGSPKKPSLVVANLSEIMSEQLATSLQTEEDDLYVKEELLVTLEDIAQPLINPSVDTSCDHMIAQMLQIQFSREHDDVLKRVEQKYNGDSKGVNYFIFVLLEIN